jgi:hypothetical protein
MGECKGWILLEGLPVARLTPNQGFNRTAKKRRFSVPSALRAPAAG